MYRYLCEQEDESVEPSSLAGYFISYLLEHFAHVVATDMGCDPIEAASDGLFDTWAYNVDKDMV